MALLKARENAMRQFRPVLAHHDLTEQQWRVLRALSSTSSPLDVGELADATFLLAPSLSRMLGNLERRGLVDRAIAPDDQRRSMLSLTPNGARLVADVAPDSEAEYERIERAFGRTRLRALIEELRHFAALELAHEARQEPT